MKPSSRDWFKVRLMPDRSYRIETPTGPILIDAKIKLKAVNDTAKFLRTKYETNTNTPCNR